MEWCVPLQKLEISKIRIGNLISKPHREKKPMAPLAYVDGQMVMPVLSILMPHMTIESYNAGTGKLELRLDSPVFASKLNAVQTNLLTALTTCQQTWFNGKCFSFEDIQSMFQPMIEANSLHLYCPSGGTGAGPDKRKPAQGIPIWKEDQWTYGIRPGILKAGDRIRVALQIQGISLQLGQTESVWTGRSRLQHKIIAIFVQPPKSSE
jgi:hypothetical protein